MRINGASVWAHKPAISGPNPCLQVPRTQEHHYGEHIFAGLVRGAEQPKAFNETMEKLFFAVRVDIFGAPVRGAEQPKAFNETMEKYIFAVRVDIFGVPVSL